MPATSPRRVLGQLVIAALALILLGVHATERIASGRSHLAVPSDDDPQTVALFACSWKLTTGAFGTDRLGGTGTVWTFSRDELTVGQLSHDGFHTLDSHYTEHWVVDLQPGRLVVSDRTGRGKLGREFLIRGVNAQSLTLELVEGGRPTSWLIVFAGQPRAAWASDMPGYSFFASVQLAAALVAYRIARHRTRPVSRFAAFLAAHFGLALLLTLVALALDGRGVGGLGELILLFLTAILSLILGVLGGLVHAGTGVLPPPDVRPTP